MELDSQGFLRPVCDRSPPSDESAGSDSEQAATDQKAAFLHACPGIAVRASKDSLAKEHPTMGPYHSSWLAWAVDPEIRYHGSSAGVLSALSDWLIRSGRADSVVGAGPSSAKPTRTVPLTLRTRDEVIAASGSRYAPVGNVALFDAEKPRQSFVGKPCETYAVSRLLKPTRDGESPVLLSFFCAGTPSQHATDKLVTELGFDPAATTSLRYRGNGWPGRFTVEDQEGERGSLTYEQAWGEGLGRAIQDRCKICPDGTGGHADIAVGDYWKTDSRGYPLFEEADGSSVAIGRTAEGHRLLLAAMNDGVLHLEPLELDAVAAVQPLQVERRKMLLARVLGRRLAGHRSPKFRGYHSVRSAAANWRKAIRVARSSYRRAKGRPKGIAR